MKTKPNLPEPTLNENVMFSNLKNTMRVISGVLKLTKKIFML
ncbi:hypothetical protein [Winogradskyella algicola]|nr:hypothetical protein [Winogradskyella algicola]